MADAPLARLILDRFDDLPPQLRAAARFVLDHPHDVALLSTREQAQRAGVSPAALTRLAQRLDLAGYEEVRRHYAQALRGAPAGLAGRAEELVATGGAGADAAFVAGFLQAMGEDLSALADGDAALALAQAADALAGASRVKCLGLRSSFAVAYMAAYVMSLVGVRAELVDAPGGAGLDRLRDLAADDAVLAISVRPYTRTVRQALAFARGRGATVVAVTDDPLSPVARTADIVVRVRIETPSFFHAMTPAFATVECLAALVARRRGVQAPAAARRAEEHLAAFGVYDDDERRR